MLHPKYRRNQKVAKLATRCNLACPGVFFLIVWTSFIFPNDTLKLLPPVLNYAEWSRGGSSATGEYAALPLMPKDISQAFCVGRMYETFWQARLNGDDVATSNALADASKVCLGSEEGPLTEDVLLKIKEYIVEASQRTGIVGSVTSVFTIVNTVFVLAIFGLSYSFLKVVIIIADAYLESIYNTVQCAYIPVTFAVACGLILHSLSYSSLDTGFYFGLSGIGIGLMTSRYVQNTYENDTSTDLPYYIPALYTSLLLAPPCVYFESTLLGCVCVYSFNYILGFSVLCDTLLFFGGWKTQDALNKSAVVSALVLLAYLAMLSFGMSPKFLSPFRVPGLTLNAITLLVAFLLRSCETGKKDLFTRNVAFIVVSFSVLLTGTVFALQCLVNTALTLIVIFVMAKVREAIEKTSHSVAIFVVSLCMFAIAWFLHTHPKFVLDIFLEDTSTTQPFTKI
mmetsp:Transcript_19216/g.32008  ORF Transcript_19216/g.32008 Transcript_19216/m.32008 type:complete len:453 (-) Transcript_19216:148-1506(-)|eukprot:CAMPEP_0203756024 /NCGR_PEP_ID=MMETSP0098-20131031/9347_1 /ASSEMBLY_ACC=CAM_ASM_000208 /TAXON_ID=96639 /ORGANISM=" , Strain NY0313808BC1" /LENGTH=452 /DNA_ID=CAMNT_0050647699 /DNA_START=141 /DNA_END=1499 /DNA_ORIENTATION=-